MKEHTLLWSAIHELKIDVPVMRYEIVGADGISPSIILYLYGGQVVTYTPKVEKPAPAAKPAPKPAKPAAKPAASKPKSKPIGGTPHGGTPHGGTPQ
jgi:hypothetical protein